MKILLITQLYPQPDDTGENRPTRTVEYFAREWIKKGHDVIVVHCPSKFPLLFYLIPSSIKNAISGTSSNIVPSLKSRRNSHRKEFGIRVYRFPMFKLFPGKGYSDRELQKQAKIIMQLLANEGFNPDAVLGHFANPSTGLVAIISEKYQTISSIVFHNDCNEKTIEKYNIKKYISRIKAVGVRSRIEAEDVKARLDLKENPFICYSGAPKDAMMTISNICKKHDYHDGVKYLFVGSFIKRKNLKSVITAFASLGNKENTLTIVGGGPEYNKLKSFVDGEQICSSVTFTGRIPREEVIGHMREAHVFALVSDNETFGMVYIEAMLQGCLTVASRGGGFDGIIIDGENGFLCNPGDDQMLGRIFRRIEGMTEAERNLIGQRAINTAKNFSEEEVAERYLLSVLSINKVETHNRC